jgi:hypothetical protein
LPEEWFPAKARMVVFCLKSGELTVTVDPNFPNIWRREPYYSLLLHFAELQRVTIRIGRRYVDLAPDGAELEDDSCPSPGG